MSTRSTGCWLASSKDRLGFRLTPGDGLLVVIFGTQTDLRNRDSFRQIKKTRANAQALDKHSVARAGAYA
jgi:hypothetical protein